MTTLNDDPMTNWKAIHFGSIWMKAYTAVIPISGINCDEATQIADRCLADYRERFEAKMWSEPATSGAVGCVNPAQNTVPLAAEEPVHADHE